MLCLQEDVLIAIHLSKRTFNRIRLNCACAGSAGWG